MKLLELTLGPPQHNIAANIALDDALLETAESGCLDDEILRFWEPEQPLVVIGRSSPIEQEVNLEFCQEHRIPVFRRPSGGAAVVTAPGCLMYGLLLDYRRRPGLRMLQYAHEFVMTEMQRALRRIEIETRFEGTCDLTINGRKVSGNALRCKRNWMIYHGTFVCRDMQTDLIANCLGKPQREPDYRGGRSHADFVTRIPMDVDSVVMAIKQQWNCDSADSLDAWPHELTRQLVATKYATDSWNRKI
jgi:lipoate-protein ligase A